MKSFDSTNLIRKIRAKKGITILLASQQEYDGIDKYLDISISPPPVPPTITRNSNQINGMTDISTTSETFSSDSIHKPIQSKQG